MASVMAILRPRRLVAFFSSELLNFGFVISDPAEEKAVQSMLVIKIRTTLKYVETSPPLFRDYNLLIELFGKN